MLTGVLDAGRTTLPNRILSGRHGHRCADIINEVGETGIDDDLVAQADEAVFVMNNACICCTVRGDHIGILSGLMKRRGQLDASLIHTAGLADPAPGAQTFHDDVATRTSHDAVVTVADAVNLATHPDEAHEAAEQLALADVVLLNEADLVEAAAPVAVEARIRAISPTARTVRTTRCDGPLDEVLGLRALDPVLAFEPDVLDGDLAHEHEHEHEHEEDVRCLSLRASPHRLRTLPGVVRPSPARAGARPPAVERHPQHH